MAFLVSNGKRQFEIQSKPTDSTRGARYFDLYPSGRPGGGVRDRDVWMSAIGAPVGPVM